MFICVVIFVVFFFQAEDGIRDGRVTGVQTCALPIYGLQLSPAATLPTGTVAMLDVSILQDRLLDPILGIKDIRTDKRVDFIGGLRGTKELERLVNEGKAVVAFSLFPTTVAELLMVSDANEIMPPKSTWFEPKLRDGLLIHTI